MQLGLVGMAPSDAERMSGRVDVDDVAFVRVEVTVLQHGGAERKGSSVCSVSVVDVEIDVDLLLRVPVRPLGWCVVGGVLDTDAPLSACVDDAVESLVLFVDDLPVE